MKLSVTPPLERLREHELLTRSKSIRCLPEIVQERICTDFHTLIDFREQKIDTPIDYIPPLMDLAGIRIKSESMREGERMAAGEGRTAGGRRDWRRSSCYNLAVACD